MNQPSNPHEFPVPEPYRSQFKAEAEQAGSSQSQDVESTDRQSVSPLDAARLAVAEATSDASVSHEYATGQDGQSEVQPTTPEVVANEAFSIGQELEKQRNRLLGV